MFTAALSTTAKIWKEPKCPSMDEWINKMWYIYTMEYYSTIKNNLDICNCVDGTKGYYAKWNYSVKGKYHMTSLIWGI